MDKPQNNYGMSSLMQAYTQSETHNILSDRPKTSMHTALPSHQALQSFANKLN